MNGQKIEDVSRELRATHPSLRIVEIPTGVRPQQPRPGIIQITSRDGMVTGVIMPPPPSTHSSVPMSSLKGRTLEEVVRYLRSQYQRDVRSVEEGQMFSVEIGSQDIVVHYETILDKKIVTRVEDIGGAQRILESSQPSPDPQQQQVNENTRIRPIINTRSKSQEEYTYAPLPPVVDPQFINITPAIGCPRPQEFEGKAIMNQETGELFMMERGVLRPFDMYTYKMHNAPSYTAFGSSDLRNCPIGAPVSRHEPQSVYAPTQRTQPTAATDPVSYVLIHASSKDEKNVLMCLTVRNRSLVLEEFKVNEMAMMWHLRNGTIRSTTGDWLLAHDRMCLAPILIQHKTASSVWSFVNAGGQYEHRIVSGCNKSLSADMTSKSVSLGDGDNRWYIMPVQVAVQKK